LILSVYATCLISGSFSCSVVSAGYLLYG